MEFSPFNHIVKLCLQGMELQEKGLAAEAKKIFLSAWDEATHEFEKFLAAYYLAGSQADASEWLSWYNRSLQIALQIDDASVKSAYAALYNKIAKCHEELGNDAEAKHNYALANSLSGKVFEQGPFYHGTKADLQAGDFLQAGFGSNYKDDLKMNHVYFTALRNGAALAAALAKGDGADRIYLVEPTGEYENDPNLTDQKFPGNLTRSYRTSEPLKIIGEIAGWQQQMPEEIRQFRDKLANSQGKIIN